MLKIGICIDCFEKGVKVPYPLIAGRCQMHYKLFRIKVLNERNAKREKCNNVQLSKKYHKSNHAGGKENLVSWYSARKKECLGRCAECYAPIPFFLRHSSIAHVLPKNEMYGFPSVATHEENFIELGPGAVCGCHVKYDLSWLSASKMKVWPLALEKFKKIEPFIADEELKQNPAV